MKIVYCGFGRAGLECLYQLLGGYNISASDILVFTHESDENNEFIKHLQINKIKYFTQSVNDYKDDLLEFNPDYLLSVYYRYIIKNEILELVDYKAMNLHPSLLPAYRGTKSSVWALLNNEKETGVSFHYINEKIDDGNIILQEKITINSNDTAYSLYHKLIGVFAKNFNKAFALVIERYEGEKQVGEISYYPRKLPYEGVRKFSNVSYLEASLFVRAMYFPPFKGAFFKKDDGEKVEILYVDELENYRNFMGELV